MITRDEYLKALDIVEEYHKQLKLQKNSAEIGSINLSLSSLKVGDRIILTKKRSNMKYFTLGKSYEILDLYDSCGRRMLQIENDKGVYNWVSSVNKYKAWVRG